MPRSWRIGAAFSVAFAVTRDSSLVGTVLGAQPRPGAQEDGPARYSTPASVHLAANEPLHSSSLVTYPSATTSLMLSMVMACGASRTEGTSLPLSGSLTVSGADPCSPLASPTASA